MNEQKSKVVAILLFLFFALVGLLVVFFLFSKQLFKSDTANNSNNDNIEEYFCTADAKLCPDGSYVSRMRDGGCKFAPCPGEDNTDSNVDVGFLPETGLDANNLDWQEFVQDGLKFRAPKEIPGLEFVRLESWPPKVVEFVGNFVCDSGVQKEINGRNYCIVTNSEGAAESVFTTYKYMIDHLVYDEVSGTDIEKIVSIEFIVQYPQCLNYDSPQSETCIQEEQNFNLDSVVDTIVESIFEPELEA